MDAYAKKDFLDSLKETRTQASWFFSSYYCPDEEFDEDYYIEDDEDIYWTGNILSIGDIFVSLDDIETIAKEEIPLEVFLSHYDFCMEYEEGIPRINLHTFHQFWKWDNTILDNPVEWAKNWHKKNEERINTPEFKAEMKAYQDKMLEDFKKSIEPCVANNEEEAEYCERLLIEEFISGVNKRHLEKEEEKI